MRVKRKKRENSNQIASSSVIEKLVKSLAVVAILIDLHPEVEGKSKKCSHKRRKLAGCIL